MTRSPGPIGSSVRNSEASASTKAAALRWLTATPLGLPVEPEVKMIHASCSGPGRAAAAPAAGGVGDVDARSGAQHRPYPGLAEDQLGALVRVLGVDRHVGGARGEHGQDARVQLVGAGGHAYPDPVAEAHPGGREGQQAALDLGGQRPVGQPGGAVVQGELVGVRPYGGFEDVDEGARRGGGPGGEAGGFAGLLALGPVRVPAVEQSEFTVLRCCSHRPSRLVPGSRPGRRMEPRSARVVPFQRQTTHQSSAASRIFLLKPDVWPGRNDGAAPG